MPADIDRLLVLGRRGLNLRDHLGSLQAGELADSLNWQLSRTGDLVKRLGFVPLGVSPPAGPSLTVSGNETTDAVRSALVEGDGWPTRPLPLTFDADGEVNLISATNTEPWTGWQGSNVATQLDFVDSNPLPRQGTYSVRYIVAPGQNGGLSGERSEHLVTPSIEADGQEHWYAWSTFFPVGFNRPAGWFIWTQFHSNDARFGQAPVKFQLDTVAGEQVLSLVLTCGPFANTTDAATPPESANRRFTGFAPISLGLWHDIVFRIRYSRTGKGMVQIYHRLEGESSFTKVAEAQNIYTLPTIVGDSAADSIYLKQGIYRGVDAVQTSYIYHDGFRRGGPELLQGYDYAPPAMSGFGIWPAVTNLVTNSSFVTNTTGWVAQGAATTITRITSETLMGNTALQIDMDATGSASSDSARYGPSLVLTNGSVYTASVWVKSDPGTRVRLYALDSTNTTLATKTITARGIWERISVTFTANANNNHQIRVGRTVSGATQQVFIKGAQVELGQVTTPLKRTDGGTAARGAGRVRFPSSLLSSLQGWFATELRMGWDSASGPGAGTGTPRVFDWTLDANNYVRCYFNEATQSWKLERKAAGVGSTVTVPVKHKRNQRVVVVAAWTATLLKLSVNGYPFVSGADAHIPTGMPADVDVGSSAGTAQHIASDVRWTAAGSGTLVDADALAINDFTEVPEPHSTSWPSTALTSFSWTADTASYDDASGRIIGTGILSLTSGQVFIVAYCNNGAVYASGDAGTTWTQIKSGLSTTARPSFVQYLDKIYMANGVDQMQSWDGVAGSMTAIASAPVGDFLAVWRNRLWVAEAKAKKVSWSKAGDPTDWTNTYNNVVFPDFNVLTGLVTAPNIGADSTAGDGVLVFAGSSGFSRIYDDTDNALGAIVGGANVLVDAENGAVSHWTISQMEGRAYYLAHDGVYSTDGHSEAKLESRKIGPAFAYLLDYGHTVDASGQAFQGRYYLSFRTTGTTYNSRTLELYTDLPADDEGQHPWMAHDIAAREWIVYPGPTGQRLYFVDDSLGDRARLRWAFQGGSDADGSDSALVFSCTARTGGENFGIITPKEVRRVSVIGSGTVELGILSDFREGVGDERTFQMNSAFDTWGNGEVWGEGIWGPIGGVSVERKYYSARGRYFTFIVRESSDAIGLSSDVLGITISPTGGATVEALDVTLIPLDCA